MTTLFIFSDEVGEYRPKPWVTQKANQSFCLRSAYVIDASIWRELDRLVRTVKKNCGLSERHECKWSHCWSAISILSEGRKIKETKDFAYMNSYSVSQLEGYLDEVVPAILSIPSVRTFFVCSRNGWTGHSASTIEKWQLQNFMQRCEMEVQSRGPDWLGVVYFDPIDRKIETRLRNTYFDLFNAGDFLSYSNIMDSINFQASHHSAGIQAADLVAGILSGALKGHHESTRYFNEYLKQTLRSHPRNGAIKGVGLISVPRGTMDGLFADRLSIAR